MNIFIISMFDLLWVRNFIKISAILRANLTKYLISGQDPQFQISYLWLTSLKVLGAKCQNIGNIFHFWDQFSRNVEIDTCFNVELVLLVRNFDFFGGYLVDTTHYLVAAAGYCLLPGAYWCLLLVTGFYCSLLLVPTFSVTAFLRKIATFLDYALLES